MIAMNQLEQKIRVKASLVEVDCTKFTNESNESSVCWIEKWLQKIVSSLGWFQLNKRVVLDFYTTLILKRGILEGP